MVFAKALPFARLSLGKTISHGYAQSLVATSHSWNASQTLQNRFQKQHGFGYNPAPVGFPKPTTKETGGELFDYLKEWHSHQKLGPAGWSQYQFAKRIEWKPHALPDQHKDGAAAQQPEHSETREALSSNLGASHDSAAPGQSNAAEHGALDEHDDYEQVPVTQSLGAATSPSKQSLVYADHYADQLDNILAREQYADIPPVFELMLEQDIVPTTKAYNALLIAAMHLPQTRRESVRKALQVYADMLQRGVLPDLSTYKIIVEMLSAHALHIHSLCIALEDKHARYRGFDFEPAFILTADQCEQAAWAGDDWLQVALRFFDAATTIYPNGLLSDRTYRLLVIACAEKDKIIDMVKVFSRMAEQRIIPSADVFLHMIPAFARNGDVPNAVETYNEYKQLAMAHNAGQIEFARRDNDVYAAMVRSFIASCHISAANSFVAKLEAACTEAQPVEALRDIIGLKGFLPEWLKAGLFDRAYGYINESLTHAARDVGFAALCIRAADRNDPDMATKAFDALSREADKLEPVLALCALQLRNGDIIQAVHYWNLTCHLPVRMDMLPLATMHAIAAMPTSHSAPAMLLWRSILDRIRERFGAQTTVVSQIHQSIELVAHRMLSHATTLVETTQLFAIIVDHDVAISPLAAHLLARFTPENMLQLDSAALQALVHVQAIAMSSQTSQDLDHEPRFTHMLHLLMTAGTEPSLQTCKAISEALIKLDCVQLYAQWHSRFAKTHSSHVVPSYLPGSPSHHSVIDETTDPYMTTTDVKGSIAISDMLDRSRAKSSCSLADSLVLLQSIRRSGRHPKASTYAKMISAAAKDNKLHVAQDVLALARHDIPFLPQYQLARSGWILILDAMMAACLQCADRVQAQSYHRELSSMAAIPSSNTFGLYITTLSATSKTFDEASEAVNIFLQAKADGVEPSSFLYNALIGKLGKARRIDDCLFYFDEMRALGIRPTSVTYGTIVNALCRVSDEKFAQDLFDEMETMPNYKPRPAPYHSMMQFFLSTKQDRAKVLSYYERMRARNIAPTIHTFKLLIDAYASIGPVDMLSAENILDKIRAAGLLPDAVHYAALIHAHGCVAHDMLAAQRLFDQVIADSNVSTQACLYQALFEGMAVNRCMLDSTSILKDMRNRGVQLTPYVANALIHGWSLHGDIISSEKIFLSLPAHEREPSTYEAMTRAYLNSDMRDKAKEIVQQALACGYPTAVISKIGNLLGGANALSDHS